MFGDENAGPHHGLRLAYCIAGGRISPQHMCLLIPLQPIVIATPAPCLGSRYSQGRFQRKRVPPCGVTGQFTLKFRRHVVHKVCMLHGRSAFCRTNMVPRTLFFSRTVASSILTSASLPFFSSYLTLLRLSLTPEHKRRVAADRHRGTGFRKGSSAVVATLCRS